MIRIVMADDHAIVREGLKRIVSSAEDMMVLDEAATATRSCAGARAEFDVLVLDLSMPGRSGMELIKLVKAEKPKLRILVLSMHQEQQYAVRSIKAGASGYLTKESAPAQLVQAIRKIASGGAFIRPKWRNSWRWGPCPAGSTAPHESLSAANSRCFACWWLACR
jgi:DNA-binding NarL/FixJ family response regulator